MLGRPKPSIMRAPLTILVAVLALLPAGARTTAVQEPAESPAYRSTNGGRTWERIALGRPGRSLHNIRFHPAELSTVYALNSYGGWSTLVRSTDGGVSWGAPAENAVHLHSFAVDPSAPGRLVGGTLSGVMRSEDGGATWTTLVDGLGQVDDLAVHPTNPNVVYAATFSKGVFKTEDGGVTWRRRNRTLGGRVAWDLAIDPRRPARVYATLATGTYRSVNGGREWQRCSLTPGSTGLSYAPVLVDPKRGSTLYVGTAYEGIFKSTDGGHRWTSINVGIPGRGPVYEMAIDPQAPATLYVGMYQVGLLKSEDGGASWRLLGDGRLNPYVESVALDPGDPNTVLVGSSRTGT
jgi:photosystem II stability/assembly factor-like uncharacterized protein